MSGLYGGSKEFGSGSQGPPSSSPGQGSPSTPSQSTAKLEFHADADPLKAGEDNPFHVNLTDATGKPIADARVTVTLVMPAMPSMSMPEMKNSFDLQWIAAKQMYAGKGQAPMEGSWTVIVEARSKGGVIASLHTHLNAK
jgi:nitrogen fixation protein FixH